MTPERLTSIRERIDLYGGLDPLDTSDLLAEVERFRAGIEYLRGAVRLGARTNAEPEAVHVLQIIHDDLVDLLNPTEGETDDR